MGRENKVGALLLATSLVGTLAGNIQSDTTSASLFSTLTNGAVNMLGKVPDVVSTVSNHIRNNPKVFFTVIAILASAVGSRIWNEIKKRAEEKRIAEERRIAEEIRGKFGQLRKGACKVDFCDIKKYIDLHHPRHDFVEDNEEEKKDIEKAKEKLESLVDNEKVVLKVTADKGGNFQYTISNKGEYVCTSYINTVEAANFISNAVKKEESIENCLKKAPDHCFEEGAIAKFGEVKEILPLEVAKRGNIEIKDDEKVIVYWNKDYDDDHFYVPGLVVNRKRTESSVDLSYRFPITSLEEALAIQDWLLKKEEEREEVRKYIKERFCGIEKKGDMIFCVKFKELKKRFGYFKSYHGVDDDDIIRLGIIVDDNCGSRCCKLLVESYKRNYGDYLLDHYVVIWDLDDAKLIGDWLLGGEGAKINIERLQKIRESRKEESKYHWDLTESCSWDELDNARKIWKKYYGKVVKSSFEELKKLFPMVYRYDDIIGQNEMLEWEIVGNWRSKQEESVATRYSYLHAFDKFGNLVINLPICSVEQAESVAKFMEEYNKGRVKEDVIVLEEKEEDKKEVESLNDKINNLKENEVNRKDGDKEVGGDKKDESEEISIFTTETNEKNYQG